MKDTLKKYFPLEILSLVESIIKEKGIHFTITRDRKTKAGDYRSPRNGYNHRISINSSLNKYAFTITFFHEYAHLLVWESFGNKVDPHGKQWKSAFSKMIYKLLDLNFFPDDVSSALRNYAINPKASTHSDVFLSKTLMEYDENSNDIITVLDIEEGKPFKLKNGRIFIRGEMKRTRIWCKEYRTNSTFAFNPNSEVEFID